MPERAKHTTVGLVTPGVTTASRNCTLVVPVRVTSEINAREPRCDVRERAATQRAAVAAAFRAARWRPSLPSTDTTGPIYSVVLTRLCPQFLTECYLESGFRTVRDAVLDALGEERDTVMFTYCQQQTNKYGVRIDVALLQTEECVA